MRIDLGEGLRRIGLLSGILGLMAGGYILWAQYQMLDARHADASAWTQAKSEGRAVKRRDGGWALLSRKKLSEDDLGQLAKRRYPGVYDDLTDEDLGRRLRTHFEHDRTGEWVSNFLTDRDVVDALNGLTVERTFYSEPVQPEISEYLALLCWPVGGFLVPWGALRILRWVLAGFLPRSA